MFRLAAFNWSDSQLHHFTKCSIVTCVFYTNNVPEGFASPLSIIYSSYEYRLKHANLSRSSETAGMDTPLRTLALNLLRKFIIESMEEFGSTVTEEQKMVPSERCRKDNSSDAKLTMILKHTEGLYSIAILSLFSTLLIHPSFICLSGAGLQYHYLCINDLYIFQVNLSLSIFSANKFLTWYYNTF